MEALGYAGLVLKAFGGGHVPAPVVPALADLASRLPVVLTSRIGGGEVLQETFLDGLKARILLSLLLADGADLERARTAFEQVNASVSAPDIGGAHPTGGATARFACPSSPCCASSIEEASVVAR